MFLIFDVCVSCSLLDYLYPCHYSPIHLPLLFPRCSPMEHPCFAQTCWMTAAVSLCWWWVFCCSPPCWSWLSLPTADWPDTFSWACVSFPTAVPCTRTCPPHAARGPTREAAVASGGLPRGRGRGRAAYGCRRGEKRKVEERRAGL